MFENLKGISRKDLIRFMMSLVPPSDLKTFLIASVTEDNIEFVAEAIKNMKIDDGVYIDGYYHVCKSFLLYQEMISMEELATLENSDYEKLMLLFFSIFNTTNTSSLNLDNYPTRELIRDHLVQSYYANKTKNSYADEANLVGELQRTSNSVTITSSDVTYHMINGKTAPTDAPIDIQNNKFKYFTRINHDSAYAEKHIRLFSLGLNGNTNKFYQYIQRMITLSDTATKPKAVLYNEAGDEEIIELDINWMLKFFGYGFSNSFTTKLHQLADIAANRTISYKINFKGGPLQNG